MDVRFVFMVLVVYCLHQLSKAENLVGLMGLRSRKHRRLTTTREPPSRVQRPDTSIVRHNVPARNDSAVSVVDGLNDFGDGCYSSALLQCSFVLLRDAIQNTSSPCDLIMDYHNCLTDSLRIAHRTSIYEGLTAVDEIRKSITKLSGCHGNISTEGVTHRHPTGPKDDDLCCVDSEIRCVFQTFLKIVSPQGASCHVIDYFSLCLHETSRDCHMTLPSSPVYTVFTFELKRRCYMYRSWS